MDTPSELSLAVARGNAFFREIMEWDPKKGTLPVADLQGHLNERLTRFVRSANTGLSATLAFGDVHARMQRQWHTELAFVEVQGAECRLLFDASLLTQKDPHAGLIFVAKSWIILWVIAKALTLNPALKGSFVFEIGDNATLGQVGYTSSHPNACLILDYDFAASDGYADYRTLCNAQLVPWEERAAKVFWRGTTTGRRLYPPPPDGEPDELRWLARLALCKACAEPALSELCDVGITSIQQIPEPYLQARIAATGFLKAAVPRRHFMTYRGVFDIDGNANAWSGLFCSLLGASCILKVESANHQRQWYYDRLVAWKNYVPVKADLSDLRERVSWFATHDADARRLAENARALAVSIDTASALTQSARNLIDWLSRRPTSPSVAVSRP